MTIQESHSDDAMNVAPHLHRVLHEDDRLRILEVRVDPGKEAAMHWHPPNYSVVIAPGKIHFENGDGSSIDADLQEGQVRATKKESSHSVKNIGPTTFKALHIEFKD